MSSTVERLVASWDDVIPAAMRRNDVPGLAIGICDANGTLWTRGTAALAAMGAWQ